MNQALQLIQRHRRSTCQMLTDLGPQEFDWVELRCIPGKLEDMQARLASDERLNLLPTDMNWGVIPDQHDRTRDVSQHGFQKPEDVVTRQRIGRALNAHPQPPTFGRDHQSADQVQAVMMVQTGPDLGRLSDWAPTALQGRNQRKALLIQPNQRCLKGQPLFLPLVARWSASHQPPRHPARQGPVAAFDGSISSGARDAKRCWGDSAPRIDQKSLGLFDPRSSDRPDSRGHKHLSAIHGRVSSGVAQSNGKRRLAYVSSAGGACAWRRLSRHKWFAELRLASVRSRLVHVLQPVTSGLEPDEPRVVQVFLWGACPRLSHRQIRFSKLSSHAGRRLHPVGRAAGGAEPATL